MQSKMHQFRRLLTLSALALASVAGAITFVSNSYNAQISGGRPQHYYNLRPTTKLPSYSRDHNVLLKYLRSTYDPNYWSFSLAGDIEGYGEVFGRWMMPSTSGNGNQFVSKFGFPYYYRIPETPDPWARRKDFIYLERVFRNGQRVEIKTHGAPFSAYGVDYQFGSKTYRQALALETNTYWQNYPAVPGYDVLTDLFVVDHYQNGPYHSVIIYDGFDQHLTASTVNLQYCLTAPRPYDPDGDTGFAIIPF